jgi:hypothetical protein
MTSSDLRALHDAVALPQNPDVIQSPKQMDTTTENPMTEPNKMGTLPPAIAATTDPRRTREGVITTIKGVMMVVIEGLYRAAVTMRPAKAIVVARVACAAKIVMCLQENTKAEPEVIDSRMSSAVTNQFVESTIDTKLLMTEKIVPIAMDPELLKLKVLAQFRTIEGLVVGGEVHLSTKQTRILEVVANLNATSVRLVGQTMIMGRTTESGADLLPRLPPAATVRATAMTVGEIHRNDVGPIRQIHDRYYFHWL